MIIKNLFVQISHPRLLNLFIYYLTIYIVLNVFLNVYLIYYFPLYIIGYKNIEKKNLNCKFLKNK